MLSYIGRRVLQLIPLLFVLSMVIFVIIELPPGDYLTMRIIQLQQAGTPVADAEIERLKITYGLDKSLSYRYFNWIRIFLILSTR